MSTDGRDATLDNLDAMIALNEQVERLHSKLEPTHFRAVTDDDEIRAFFGKALTSPDNHFLLAFAGARPAGYLWFEIQERPQTAFTHRSRRAYVHHIAVDKSARRRGIASTLLSGMEEMALSQGVWRIVLDMWVSNRAPTTSSAQGAFRRSMWSFRSRSIQPRNLDFVGVFSL